MDITPQDNTTQPISDDQELAKALAGVLPDDPNVSAPSNALPSSMQFEETPAPAAATPAPVFEAPVSVAPAPSFEAEPSNGSFDLSSIKNDALNELRPLIGRVDLPAEEKFDTYLMLIRSTDDASLIELAHGAAQNIADEKRKAEALLDIIKEIDYLSRKDQEPKA